MTRKALIELVTRRLKFTDSKTQFSIPYVQGVLDTVWQEMCVEVFNADGQDINYYTKLYPAVTIVTDIENELYHSDIPVEMIRLPRIGDGIISINQIDSRSADFKPILESNFRLMTSQEVYRVGTDIYWYARYDRVYYGESMTLDIVDSGVDMFICIPFSEYDLDEQLPLPGGMSKTFIDTAVQFLIGTPVVNTNNKNEI